MLQSLFRPVLRPIMMGVMAVTGSRRAWSPLALWPDGVSSAGMWISPSTLPASYNDSTGTTPVATPGTVADSANPVGLALDIRAGAPGTLGPELVTNGDFSDGTTGWSGFGAVWSVSGGRAVSSVSPYVAIEQDVFTLGKRYLVSIELISGPNQVYVQVNNGGYHTVLTSVGVLSFITPVISSPNISIITSGTVSGPASVDNISVKEIPGNHMLQASTTARPLESARVNLLTYTEDLLNTWSNYQATILTATTFSFDDQYANVRKAVSSPTGTAVTIQMQAAAISGNTALCIFHEGAVEGDYTAITVSGTPQLFTVTVTTAGIGYINVGLQDRNASGHGVAYLSKIQVNIGAEALTYQSVPGDGSTYDATGITPWQAYDGTDDGMATASFAAGTLIDGMDCLIAVRRDSSANAVCGLYESVSDANKVFGIAESGSSSGCVGSGAGTATVWVDNVQLTDGTAVTRGTLHTALTTGAWHILEFRGLDLSTWTASGFGLYTSYKLPGARGDIMLYPSTASTADKDAARQYLADKYGVTLP